MANCIIYFMKFVSHFPCEVHAQIEGNAFTYGCRKTFLKIPEDIHTGRTRVRMCHYFDKDSQGNLHLVGKKMLMNIMA